MKLDALFNSPQQSEGILEVSEEKFDKETSKQGKNIDIFDVKEKTLVSSRTEVEDHDWFWQESEFDSSDSVDSNAADRNTMEVQDCEVFKCQSHEDSRINREKVDHLSDKSANELEVPELVICYKEKSFFDVKDICVDENMPSCERILFETDAEKEDLRSFLLLGRDGDSSLMTETTDGAHVLPECPLGSEGQDRESPVNAHVLPECPLGSEGQDHESPVNLPVSKDVMKTTVNVYELPDDVSTSKTLSEDEEAMIVLIQQEQYSEDPQSANAEIIMPPKETIPESILSRPTLASSTDEETASFTNAEESNSNCLMNHEEKISTTSADQSNNCSNGKDISDNVNRETQVAHNISNATDTRASSFRDQYGHGEASFSMAGPVSGHIMYSGPIAYSGSLSLRSDSSTTSTRSFAFPILQSEWHSSPVRMAKADRRHMRKHKGWMQGLFCCRF